MNSKFVFPRETFEKVLDLACKEYGFTRHDYYSGRRTKDVWYFRFTVYGIMVNLYQDTYNNNKTLFRDEMTNKTREQKVVRNGIAESDSLVVADYEYKKHYNNILKQLNGDMQ